MAEAVYILCSLTSIACALLLLRGYARRKVRLLLWSGLCFLGFAINNTFTFVDLIMVPRVDLSLVRNLSSLMGILLLLYGLIWDMRE